MANDSKSVSRTRWIVPGAFMAIAGGFLVLGILPSWHESWQIHRAIREFSAQIETTTAQTEQLKYLTNRANLMKKETKFYPRLVSDNKDLGGFIGQLSTELDGAGMKDSAKQQLPPNLLAKSVQVSIEVHSSGTFEQFTDFLQRLEHLYRMSSVSRLEVKSDDAMSGKITVDLTLSIYSSHAN